MAPSSREIRIIDTTLRDAHQCLWATRMRTDHMLPVLPLIDQTGFESVDLMGSIQFDVCVRYLKEDPWERVRRVHASAPNTAFRAIIRSRNILKFDFLPDDVIELWVKRLYANGFRVIGAFDGLNDIENIVGSLKLAKQLGAYTFGALSFCESPLHTDQHYVETAKALVARADVDAIMLKDPGGLLTVDRIRALVPKLRQAVPDRPLELHSHCLTGLAPLVYLEGAKLGCDQLHLSIAPLANGAAQPAVQSVVKNLRELNYTINVDDQKIDQISQHFARIAKRENKPIGIVAEYDVAHYKHQLPGGMLSNFREQLKVAGLSHKFDELLEECARVREELAWPIMITPFAQFVGTQAAMNVLHGERYAVVPDEVKKYVLGYFGKLLGPVDSNVLDKIVSNGSAKIPVEREPIDPLLPTLRGRHPSASDDEILLRVMFAGNQVDEMRKVCSERISSSFELQSIVTELLRSKRKGTVSIKGNSLSIKLVRA